MRKQFRVPRRGKNRYYKQQDDLSCGECSCLQVIMILGLLAAGSTLLGLSFKNTRATAVQEYDVAVSNWTSSYRRSFAATTFSVRFHAFVLLALVLQQPRQTNLTDERPRYALT